MRHVAKEASVSAMTVSRVLRNDPRVAEATRARVQAAIAALGYRRDPVLSSLMERMRERSTHSRRSMLAFVYERPPLAGDTHPYVSIEAVRARAESHGFGVEAFCLGQDGLHAERLRAMLLARGIRGVLLLANPASVDMEAFDVSDFAAVSFGYGLKRPALHRASTDVNQGMVDLFAELSHRGYRRIACAITRWADVRSAHTYSGAFLHYQQSLSARRRVPLFFLPDALAQDCSVQFAQWLTRYRPDVLISEHSAVPRWVQSLGIRVPADMGFVVHDWTASMSAFAGMDHRRTAVAAAAVDLLASHLYHHEYGIPCVPRHVLVPAVFVNGASLR